MSNQNALQGLYPFLSGGSKDVAGEQQALLTSVQRKAADSVQVKQHFFAEQGDKVVEIARAVADSYRRNGRLFTMGNGGSSCDASHLAVEFLHPVTAGRPALPAVNLTADIAMLTAVGNDVGFENIFVRQLEAQAKAGDCLVGFSTSGNSENLMAAYAKAKEKGMTTIGLAGMSGGQMAASHAVDHCLVVKTDSIHRIQECHLAIYHILWDLVHTLLADHRGSAEAHA